MGTDSSRLLPSLHAGPAVTASVLRLLGFIDELPAGATGVLRFGGHGVVLLDSRKICWAVARNSGIRLTDILRNQSTPPLAREVVEEIYRKCKGDGRPIGEALLASGVVSEAGLRAALFKQNGEAIVELARSNTAPDGFTVHASTGYDPKFSFSACEVLAALGSLGDPARAIAAQIELGSTLVHESSGAAFVRSEAASGALVIAVDRSCDFPARDLLEVCNWALGLFDVARTFDEWAYAARATWGKRTAIVTWRLDDLHYVGLCSSRAAAARLMSQLGQRAASSGVITVAPPVGSAAG